MQAAIDAVRENEADDYIIAPAKHAEALSNTAPHLAEFLRGSRVLIDAQQYERHDREAIEAQNVFKDAAHKSNWMVLVTAVLSGLILATGTMKVPISNVFSDPFTDAWLAILGVGAVITGALGSMWLYKVKQGGFLEAWMSARAKAETYRINYFTTVSTTCQQPKGGDDIPLPLLQLEYFRRHQLDVQIAFYDRRRKDHRHSAAQTLNLGGAAVLLAAVAAGMAGLMGAASSNVEWVSIGALGVLGTGLSGFATTRAAVNQDRRNAERYGRTLDVLMDLKKRLDMVRKAVAAGNTEALDQFVAAVHEHLSLEHRQWLGTASETQGAFANLEKTLAKLGT